MGLTRVINPVHFHGVLYDPPVGFRPFRIVSSGKTGVEIVRGKIAGFFFSREYCVADFGESFQGRKDKKRGAGMAGFFENQSHEKLRRQKSGKIVAIIRRIFPV
jgi:hypothetical protein